MLKHVTAVAVIHKTPNIIAGQGDWIGPKGDEMESLLAISIEEINNSNPNQVGKIRIVITNKKSETIFNFLFILFNPLLNLNQF